ncbi:MAG: flagellar protein [Syntrophomonadaceae bacterium]|nr:flagellar protein [Syntrophomonadaceae bacterium]
MTNKVYFPQTVIQPLPGKKVTTSVTPDSKKTNFGQVLEKKLQGELKFSQHARQRLQSRNIELGEAEMARLENAVSKAREKGARDSLVLMDNLALVVSIKNNTVITAVDEQSLKENVFTNIDSAVIV